LALLLKSGALVHQLLTLQNNGNDNAG